MLASLVPILIVSVFMMSIKQIAIDSFSKLRDIGEWLNSLSEKVLTQITSIGISLFISSLVIIVIITFS
ncbi:hypothetical protein [Spiroplasma taiwanense]|uniref:Uncharacterized protein n=1 Tax=Spiroplasma taiwanense CT-1 TaxID=1276220 RepID=S5M058_9MOLU|nr:hypothetical protein [Spiroplasma taiwanense]AGR41387.1 hypothetical protein STAIW_v1c07990 [Spiroplasma taiwanense CT-1]